VSRGPGPMRCGSGLGTALRWHAWAAVPVQAGQDALSTGEWLVALDALLTRVVEQWLSSRARTGRARRCPVVVCARRGGPARRGSGLVEHPGPEEPRGRAVPPCPGRCNSRRPPRCTAGGRKGNDAALSQRPPAVRRMTTNAWAALTLPPPGSHESRLGGIG
jgi:hypothetical protein